MIPDQFPTLRRKKSPTCETDNLCPAFGEVILAANVDPAENRANNNDVREIFILWLGRWMDSSPKMDRRLWIGE